MKTYTLQVHTYTKYCQHYKDTVRYEARNWKQAHIKGRKFANSAYGYNNIKHIQLLTLDVRWENNHAEQEGIK